MRIGLLTALERTQDAFFPEIVTEWERLGALVCQAFGVKSPVGRDKLWKKVLPSVTRNPSPRNLGAFRELGHWAREDRLDVIVTNTATPSFLVRLSPLRVPVVYFCHGLHWQDANSIKSSPYVLAERALLRRTAGVITLNSDDEDFFARHYRGPRLHLNAGVGVDLRRFPRTPAPERAGQLRLAWVGEFSERKRPHLVLDVAEHLRGRGVNFHIEMLGDGPLLHTIQASVDTRGLRGSISTAGRGDAAAAIMSAHGLLHTAKWEGLPRVGLEAAAVGRPVFAFDTKGTRDLPNAVVVPDSNIEQLAGSLFDWWKGDSWLPMPKPELLSYRRAAARILSFLPHAMDS